MASELKSGLLGAAVDSESVCVAVHVRPLIDLETDQGCGECLQVTPGQPQVGSGPHTFTYDHVFGGDCGQDPDALYSRCVSPLVEGLFKGYNATVFAYGQTGSGKTYTMGSAFPQEDEFISYKGVIPQAMASIFARIKETQNAIFTVRVGFVEIHKEEIRDLLAKRQTGGVMIRELPSGGIVLAGSVEKEVHSSEEMVQILEQGSSLRATAETGMNKRSSRSHAIFTITLEQKVVRPEKEFTPSSAAANGENGSSESDAEEDDLGLDDYLCAKMHLVDLAGSERVKRTKAQGQRLQEGININKGLSALGNVINALSEGKVHVPYRDSKLTRMLQDSLGGNSRTLMIACVSPADVNLEESLNTLRYANRARSIKNKPVVNRDPVSAQIAALRQQLAAAKGENLELRKRLGLSDSDEVELLRDDGNSAELMRLLRESEARVAMLQRELIAARTEADLLREELRGSHEAQLLAALQRDKLAKALTAAAGEEVAAAALAEAEVPLGEESVERVLSNKVQELEDEVRKLRVARIRGISAGGGGGTPGTPSGMSIGSPLSSGVVGGGGSMSPFSPPRIPNSSTGGGDGEEGALLGEIDPGFAAEEHAYRAEMERVQSEMDLLQSQLESKEVAIAAVSGHSSMQESYESQLRELAAERDALAKERAGLLSKLKALQAASVEERVRMEKTYKERIRDLDGRVKGVDRQERKIRDLETAQKRALDSVRALQGDVQAIKEQKATLMRQANRAAKDYSAWKKDRDKEVMHLKKKGRANAAQMMRMEALQAKQLEVLRRKTEEAAAARKRLQLLESRRGGGAQDRTRRSGFTHGSSRAVSSTGATADSESDGGFTGYGPALAAALAEESIRREWVESELDTCCASYELQRVLEGEKALRSEAARQLREVERRLASLKNPQWWGGPARDGSAEREYSEDILLKKRARLVGSAEKHGRQIQEVQLALVQARAREEERGGGAADAGRWLGLAERSEVRNMMTTVFRSASQYKAQAYEAQLALTEMSEEIEMLRLKLDVAEAEKLESSMRAVEAQAAAEAMAASYGLPSASEEGSQIVDRSVVSDAHDAEAAIALRQLEQLSVDSRMVSDDQLQLLPAEVEDDYDEDDDEEEEEETSSDEEGDAWDPSQATPIIDRAGSRRQRRADSGGSSAPPSMAEMAVLEHLNATRVTRGEPPISKLTVAELRTALKGTTICGQEWRAGSKKRGEMLQDYLAIIGEQAALENGIIATNSINNNNNSTVTSTLTPEAHGDLSTTTGTTTADTTTTTPMKSMGKARSNSVALQPSSSTESGTPSKKSPFSQLKGMLRRGSASKSQNSAGSGGGATGATVSSSLKAVISRHTTTAAAAPAIDEDDVVVVDVPIVGGAAAGTTANGLESSLKHLKLGRTSSQEGAESRKPVWKPN